MAEFIEEEEEEEPGGGWLTTWADMMSVLLTFFIVLQAFSTLSEKKFYDAMASIQRALAVPMPIRRPGSSDFEARATMAEELEEQISNEGIEGISVEDYGDRLVLTVESGVLFQMGKADISIQGQDVMDTVIKALAVSAGQVRIEGHTCDLAVGRFSEYKNNWWLSNARALQALEALVSRGFPAERLAAAGYGEYHPVAPNDSEENRTKNRRVEFVIEKVRSPADP